MNKKIDESKNMTLVKSFIIPLYLQNIIIIGISK